MSVGNRMVLSLKQVVRIGYLFYVCIDMCYYRSTLGGKQMKKIVVLLLGTLLLAGCSIKGSPSQTLCELKDSGPMSYYYTIDAEGNDVTRVENVFKLEYTADLPKEGFEMLANEFQKVFEASNQVMIDTAGGKDIPGIESKVIRTDSVLELIQIQTMKDIDFDLMKRIDYYSGYDREIKGLFLDEEVSALQNNDFICTKK